MDGHHSHIPCLSSTGFASRGPADPQRDLTFQLALALGPPRDELATTTRCISIQLGGVHIGSHLRAGPSHESVADGRTCAEHHHLAWVLDCMLREQLLNNITFVPLDRHMRKGILHMWRSEDAHHSLLSNVLLHGAVQICSALALGDGDIRAGLRDALLALMVYW
eukprot:CAMPEP_0117464412 /NCGR_PEP_ID=MMETSP0784-20121206/4089_1 /TAXON_ID=39447 /ORGANISM="" /LENGTH=164 /DNA_ID=CAMNT_0005258273 /DNA_START=130 /DNA_END=622 /DNA_ORIENTATION=+